MPTATHWHGHPPQGPQWSFPTQLSLSLSHHCSANEGLKRQSAATEGHCGTTELPSATVKRETHLLDLNASQCVTAVHLPAKTL